MPFKTPTLSYVRNAYIADYDMSLTYKTIFDETLDSSSRIWLPYYSSFSYPNSVLIFRYTITQADLNDVAVQDLPQHFAYYVAGIISCMGQNTYSGSAAIYLGVFINASLVNSTNYTVSTNYFFIGQISIGVPSYSLQVGDVVELRGCTTTSAAHGLVYVDWYGFTIFPTRIRPMYATSDPFSFRLDTVTTWAYSSSGAPSFYTNYSPTYYNYGSSFSVSQGQYYPALSFEPGNGVFRAYYGDLSSLSSISNAAIRSSLTCYRNIIPSKMLIRIWKSF